MTTPIRRIPTPLLVAAAFGLMLLGAWVVIGTGTGVQQWLADRGCCTPGVLTLTQMRGCSHSFTQRTCHWAGDFVSDDRKLKLHEVELYGGLPEGRGGIGQQYRTHAVTLGRLTAVAEVYPDGPVESWKDRIPDVVGMAGVLAVGLAILVVALRRRRKASQPIG